MEELSHPDAPPVLYAIEMLEAMDKPQLVTPLLLRHESEAVRVKALQALASGALPRRGAVEGHRRADDPATTTSRCARRPSRPSRAWPARTRRR